MKISIITAVYKAETTVGEAILSVGQQSYPHIEHLVIEGNSPDGSLAAAEQAAHRRMTIISEPDTGIYDALNKGIARATGEVIGFVHSDDFLADDEVLARIAQAFSDPSVEAVYSDLDYVSQYDTARVVRRWVSRPFDRRILKLGWMPAHPTLYLRRHVYERLGGFDTSLRIAADYDFILRYFSRTEFAPVYIPEVLYKMRLGGVSNRNWDKVRQKTMEDYRAIRRNGIGGPLTLMAKNVSKIGQFLVRNGRLHRR